VGIALTTALAVGVAVYGACLLAIAVALYTQPAPTFTAASAQLQPA
jgi:hypothetical protein